MRLPQVTCRRVCAFAIAFQALIPLTGQAEIRNTFQLAFRPSGLNFGQVPAGATRSRALAIINTTGSTLTVSAIDCSGSEFSISGVNLPLTLDAGQSFTFTATFAPRASGQAVGTITFHGDAGEKELRLAGVGLAGEPSSPAPLREVVNTGGPASQPRIKQFYLQHTVVVVWRESKSRHVVGYNVYRGHKSGGPYRRINDALVPQNTFTDDRVRSGKEYYYVATAVNSKGKESRYSKQVHVFVP